MFVIMEVVDVPIANAGHAVLITSAMDAKQAALVIARFTEYERCMVTVDTV
jgi:hypothetical protein